MLVCSIENKIYKENMQTTTGEWIFFLHYKQTGNNASAFTENVLKILSKMSQKNYGTEKKADISNIKIHIKSDLFYKTNPKYI